MRRFTEHFRLELKGRSYVNPRKRFQVECAYLRNLGRKQLDDGYFAQQ